MLIMESGVWHSVCSCYDIIIIIIMWLFSLVFQNCQTHGHTIMSRHPKQTTPSPGGNLANMNQAKKSGRCDFQIIKMRRLACNEKEDRASGPTKYCQLLPWIYGLITWVCLKDLVPKQPHLWPYPKGVKDSCWVSVTLLTSWIEFRKKLSESFPRQVNSVNFLKLNNIMPNTQGAWVNPSRCQPPIF